MATRSNWKNSPVFAVVAVAGLVVLALVVLSGIRSGSVWCLWQSREYDKVKNLALLNQDPPGVQLLDEETENECSSNISGVFSAGLSSTGPGVWREYGSRSGESSIRQFYEDRLRADGWKATYSGPAGIRYTKEENGYRMEFIFEPFDLATKHTYSKEIRAYES